MISDSTGGCICNAVRYCLSEQKKYMARIGDLIFKSV